MPKTQDESIRSQLLARYKALSDDRKKLLRFLSVVYVPINQTILRKIVNTLGWQTARGMPLEDIVDKSFREEMIDRGMIVFEKNAMSCHRSIVELLTREAVDKDEFKIMVQAGEQILPTADANMPRVYSKATPEQYRTAFRGLRIAVYSGAMDAVAEQLEYMLDRFPRELRKNDPLVEIYANPFDGLWLEGLPDELRLHVLRTLLVDSALALRPAAEAFALLERLCPEANREWALCLAEQCLLRGQLVGIEALLTGGDEPKELALSGWLHFIQGDTEGSIARYGEALKALRKATRKRNLYISGLPGVFYVLALMRSGDPDHLSLARRQTAMAMKLQWEDPYLDVFSLLDACIDVLQGKSRVTDQYRLAEDSRSFEPHVTLFHALALTWAGGKPKKAHTDRLVDCGRTAQDAGMAWYAAACAGLLDRFDRPFEWEASKPARQAEGFYGLVDLIPRQEAWQRALDALKALNAGRPASSPAAEESDQALRMVWQLQGAGRYVTLHPREQKRNKNGRWTKGRPIALKRLHEEPEAFDYMTPEDRRICRHIERYTEYAYFNRYPRETFELDNDQALLAAIGHSRVFREDDPTTPVELIKGEPRLLVERKKGKLHLRLEPSARPDENVVIEPEGSHRLRVIELTEDHRQVARILGPGGLTVPSGARRQLTDSIAGLTGFITVQSDVGGGSAAEKVVADATPHIHLQPSGGGLTLELFVQPFAQKGPLFRPGEGGATVMAEIDGKRLQAQRDLEQEAQTTARVLDSCPVLAGYAEESWHLSDPETALEALLQLQTLGDAVVLEWPQGKTIRLSRAIDSKQLHVSIRKQDEWFALEGTIALDDDNVLEMSRLLVLLKQTSGRFVRLEEGQFLTLTRELRRQLDQLHTYAFGAIRNKSLYFHPLAAAAIEEVTQGMVVRGGKEWKQQLQRLTEAQTLNPLPPSTLQGELRDYQLDGFCWLARLAYWGAGACLADDMGLGKTVQALALVLTRAMHGPTLILAPTSVCMNWLDEAAHFAPTLNAQLFGAGDRTRMLDEAGPFDLTVCSYGLLQNESERLAKKEWTTIVADEAQAIKNAQTKRSKAVMALKGEFKIITTGTPIENHLGELWTLFRFINPGLLGSLDRFNQRFAGPIALHGDRDARLQLKKLIQPFILRRLKSDVMNELPPRTEITLHVELEAEEAALVEALRRQALEQLAQTAGEPGQKRIRILGEIMRLRRACCNPKLVLPDSAVPSSKLQAFGELVEELLANRHKALVFSQFVDHLTLLRDWLDQRSIRYQYLDGSTTAKKRKAAVDAFQAGKGDLFLISLKAGGTGLNLTAADYVIHMDPWWNPAVEDQASDRAHRIGQQRPVTIYRLVAKNTIEEKIVKLHARKRDLADSLLEGTGAGSAMSVEEMMALIRDVQ
jgi:SNF2-related domain/Helicase conserved C-terminal domain